MTFINSTTNLIRRSTKDIFYIFNNHGLYYNYYNKDNKLSKRNILISNNTLDYTQFYFSIADTFPFEKAVNIPDVNIFIPLNKNPNENIIKAL